LGLKPFDLNFVRSKAAPNLPLVFILRVIYEADKPYLTTVTCLWHDHD
jgi:hypothetical protein